jgi:hypothetical protein
MLREAEEQLLRSYLREKKMMSDDNITYFMNEFEKLTEQEKSEVIYEAVGKEIYKTNPVDVLTFIEDPYFLGSVYDTVFKIWKDMIQEIYPAPFCKKYDEVILSCATRCFGKGTEILMYDGSIKKVEDIVVGDVVMGDDSTPRNVLSLARGREMMYRIIPNNGEPFVCNESHILSLRCTATQERSTYYIKDAIRDITVKDYLEKPNHYKHFMKLYKVPVEFNNQEELEVDPYIYGLWLGDGHTNTTTLTSVDEEIIDIWESHFKDRNCRVSYWPSKAPHIKIIHACNDGDNDLLEVLKESTKTGHKRILKRYLTASREDRMRLLAGIIDTDGSLEKLGFTVSTKYEDLAEDYVFLARSLGFKVGLYQKRGKLKYKNNQEYTSYRVSINGHVSEIPTILSRKHKTEDKYKVNPLNTGFKVEPIGEGDFYGFELDGNHRFLLKDFTVQHNCGKTYIGTFVGCYELYLLTCLIDPLKTYSVSNIVFALLSKDNATAVSQIGGEVYKCLTQSPYFKDTTKEKLSFSKLDKDGVRVTDDIIFKAGSSISTIIGTNLFFGIVDEMNAKPSNVAAENLIENRMRLYQEMRDRRESSFSKAPKRTGMLMFTSSPTDEGDVLSEIIADTKKNGIPGVLIRDNIPRWEAREEDMDETFEFFLGSDTKDPCILDETVELKPEELDRVIQIPAKADYYAQFSSDPYLAIQNIAGRRTMPSMALFNTVAAFEKVFCKEQDIFMTDTPQISIDSFRTLEDFLFDDKKNYFSHPNRPDCYRYIHLDIAEKKDRFGLASVYSDRVKFTSEEGHEIYRRMYFVDFCLGVTAKNKESVDILKVLEFVYSLKEKGYPLKIVSTDSHQGELARQIIAKKGKVKTEYLSMEKTKEPYLNLKNIILTGCLEGYKNPPLMRELRGLRESQKKIEKGKGYTDDMSDALAGALWMCSQDKFYKKNNEAISDIIQQAGKMTLSGPTATTRNMRGLAREINNRSPFRRSDLGFRYGR